jgi:hypothetical protein
VEGAKNKATIPREIAVRTQPKMRSGTNGLMRITEAPADMVCCVGVGKKKVEAEQWWGCKRATQKKMKTGAGAGKKRTENKKATRTALVPRRNNRRAGQGRYTYRYEAFVSQSSFANMSAKPSARHARRQFSSPKIPPSFVSAAFQSLRHDEDVRICNTHC